MVGNLVFDSKEAEIMGGLKWLAAVSFIRFWFVRDNFIHFKNYFSRLFHVNNIRLLSFSTGLIYFMYTHQVYTYTYTYVDYSMYQAHWL